MQPVTYISGATGYAGLRLAENLASQGDDLVLSARDESSLHEIGVSLAKRFPNQRFRVFTCDLATPASWESAVGELSVCKVNKYINCSGTQGFVGPSSEITHDELSRVFNINLFSSIFFTNYLSKKLEREDELSVIHFSGGGSANARPLFMSYSLSKTSLVRFIENFAAENRNPNIRINAIAPGVMPSEMQKEIMSSEALRDSKDYLNAEKSLMGRNFDFSKVLNLCNFLLSDTSEGITGKLISAEWDNWAEWPNHVSEIRVSDVYTLRRIVGRDRGLEWGDL
jgi:3-oxoacyl-[acyl-carrier protein] reductase